MAQVDAASYVTSADRSTLDDDLTTFELPGIEALQPQAENTSDCAQLLAVARTMIFDYRVYLLMTPETLLTITADRLTYEADALAGLALKAGQVIETGSQSPSGAAATAALDLVDTLLGSAQSATAGLSAALLDQRPPDYPADALMLFAAANAEAVAGKDLASARRGIERIPGLLG